MGITVTEKQELRDIINKRMKKKIEALDLKNAAEFGVMRVDARNIALKEMGLDEYMTRYDDICATIKRLDKERDQLTEVAAAAAGIEEGYRPHHLIEQRVNTAQEAVFNRMLADHPVGQKIVALQKEQEHMLETVWVATSSAQVKELFRKVNEVLDESPTDLGVRAGEITPVSD